MEKQLEMKINEKMEDSEEEEYKMMQYRVEPNE